MLWIAAALAAIAVSGASYIYQGLLPVEAGTEPVKLSVAGGSGSKEIARALEQNGLIKDDFIFLLYLKANGQGSRFQAGEYEMKPGLTLREIVDKLNKGEVVSEETIRFTIPEGYTLPQIIERLTEQGLNRDKLWSIASAVPPSLSSDAVKKIPSVPGVKYVLEGYLFPETYEMPKDSTELEVLERLAKELDRKLAGLPNGWEQQLQVLGIDFHGMMTIASLIEREVAVAHEKKLVSGIIYNRLREKMPLQIDATVQYLFEKQKDRLYEKDLQVESPYNTYLNSGLPPGPIASPGLSSIEAALYPEQTKFLFYVTKKDGSREHLFAETFEQHKKNIAASKMNQ
nr:endolytic transglycosylase MltG [Paenibacillus turpanensis]